MCVFIATKITIIVRIRLKFVAYFLARCFRKELLAMEKWQLPAKTRSIERNTAP